MSKGDSGVLSRFLVDGVAAVRGSSLHGFDATCFRSERPDDPNDVLVVLVFAGPVDHARLRQLVCERLVPHAHFHQRVARGRFGRLHWVDVEVEVTQHLHFSRLPAGAGQAELTAAIASILSTAVDLTRPLWSLHLFDGYAGERSVLVARIEHTLGDGAALLRLLPDLTESLAGELPMGGPAANAPKRPLPRIPAPWSSESRARWLRFARLPAMRVPSLSGKATGRRAFAWSQAIPLDRLRTLARRESATINDVVLAAIAGALRCYLRERGVATDGLPLTAMLPVSLRAQTDADEASAAMNQFGFVYLELPLQLEASRARLHAIRRAMRELKLSADAAVSLMLSTGISYLPASLAAKANAYFASKSALLISNLPGPIERVVIAGQAVERMFFSGPGAGAPLTACVFSYHGALQLAVRSAANVVPDPDAIVRAFEAELAALTAEGVPHSAEVRMR